jgi:hypothetical protein
MHYFVGDLFLLHVGNKNVYMKPSKNPKLNPKISQWPHQNLHFEFTNTNKNGPKIYDLNGYKLFYSRNW